MSNQGIFPFQTVGGGRTPDLVLNVFLQNTLEEISPDSIDFGKSLETMCDEIAKLELMHR